MANAMHAGRGRTVNTWATSDFCGVEVTCDEADLAGDHVGPVCYGQLCAVYLLRFDLDYPMAIETDSLEQSFYERTAVALTLVSRLLE